LIIYAAVEFASLLCLIENRVSLAMGHKERLGGVREMFTSR
jgi:hypothetical protein